MALAMALALLLLQLLVGTHAFTAPMGPLRATARVEGARQGLLCVAPLAVSALSIEEQHKLPDLSQVRATLCMCTYGQAESP